MNSLVNKIVLSHAFLLYNGLQNASLHTCAITTNYS